MKAYRLVKVSLLLFLVVLSHPVTVMAEGTVLSQDTVWEGEILLEEDVLVPEGITLTVRKNSVIAVTPSGTTRIDPQYMSAATEITVRGRLLVEGLPGEPVLFRSNPSKENGDPWGGVIIDGGSASIVSATIQDAEIGIWVPAGTLELKNSTLTSNQYGLVVQRQQASVRLPGTTISGNSYGVVALNGAVVDRQDSVVEKNLKKDVFTLPDAPVVFVPEASEVPVPSGQPLDLVDKVLLGNTVWEGIVRVTGQVRVPVDSRLVIMPGTIVEFVKKDTNNDGLGESGLMMQGVLIAKGTPENPILFRSAETEKVKGDWDAVNIINSDGVRNLIEYCRFEDGYRGLHFHFSNVMVQHSVFRNNYRGVQFQESNVELRSNTFYHNVSAVQARDSEIVLARNRIVNNIFGANFLRTHLTINGNRFGGNLDYGLKVREGFPTVTRNIFDRNRFGLMFSDNNYGSITGNLMAENSEAGLSLKAAANVEIRGNFIQGNHINGLSVRDSAAVIEENQITGNDERGIGVASFKGPISRNTLLGNGLYAIGIEDGNDVSAPMNWYDRAEVEPLIFDREDDPARGKAQYEPVAEEPPLVPWVIENLPVDATWSGKIGVKAPATVSSGVTLTIQPGSTVLFGKEAGMHVYGRIVADGTRDRRIRFSALDGKVPNSWGELMLEQSVDSRFLNCDFEYGQWALHSHFSTMLISGCTFVDNGGGVRFRSGPLMIRNSLFQGNKIGIRAFMGNGDIVNNVITQNVKGIFVREKGAAVRIHRNNIFENKNYSIWVGDFNDEDIPADHNWWGVDDPATTIYDARVDPGIGLVLFEPPLPSRLEIGIEDPGGQ